MAAHLEQLVQPADRRSSIISRPTTAFPTGSIPASRTAARSASRAAAITAQLTFRDWHPVGGDERDYDIPDPADPNIVYRLAASAAQCHANGMRAPDRSRTSRRGRSDTYGKRPTLGEISLLWVTPLVAPTRSPLALSRRAGAVPLARTEGKNWNVISGDLTGKIADAKNCDGKSAGAPTRKTAATARSPRSRLRRATPTESGSAPMTG